MKTYFKVPCPNCQQVVSIRAEYFGKRVACKHCRHVYTPKPAHVTAAAAAAPLTPSPVASALDTAAADTRTRVAAADTDVPQAREEAAARARDHAQAAQNAERAQAEAAQLVEQLQALRREADAREQELADHRTRAERATQLEADLVDARAEAARLNEQLQALRRESEEAVERQRQEFETQHHELSDVRADAEWLRTVVAEVQDAEKRAGEVKAKVLQELDAVRSERDRLRDEVGQAQTDRQELARQRQETEDRAAQLQLRIGELKQALTDATDSHAELVQGQEELFNRWQAERQDLHGHWEQKHRNLGEEAEERLRVEREQRQREMTSLQRQFAEEKAALETEVGQARAEVATLHKARQALADQLTDLQRQRDEFAVKVDQLEAARAEREEQFQADLNRLNDAVEAVSRDRSEHTGANKELVEQVRTLHAESTSLQAELQRARSRMADLESGAGRAGEVEARLKAEIAGLREGLAAAESRAGELDAIRAERDQLRQQVQQSAERQSAHEVDGNVLAKALEGVSPRAGWPWFESPRKAEPAPVNANKGDAEAVDQQLAAVQQELSRERAMLQNEVAKLKKENTLLRQYLENFGVQMIQM